MKRLMLVLLVSLFLFVPMISQAIFSEDWRDGFIQKLYVDPSDVVLQMDTSGPCGSNFFHIRRSNANFHELYAAILMAKGDGLRVGLAVIDCAEGDPGVFDRNVVSHGYIE